MELIGRIKTVAEQKVGEAKARVEKEKEYQRYKHPDIGYLRTGKTTTDYKQSAEFAERLEKEKKKKAAAAERRAERRTAIKSTVKAKVKELKAEASKPQKRGKREDPIFGGFGGGAVDPIGFNPGAGFDLGMGGKKGKRFELW